MSGDWRTDDVPQEQYEFVRAYIRDNELSWQYKVVGKMVAGLRHDEDVAGWSDDDIIKLTRQMLDVPDDCQVEIHRQ